MEFMLAAYDFDGNEDIGGAWYYDTARQCTRMLPTIPVPMIIKLSSILGIDAGAGYSASQPMGGMVVDYHVKAGLGEAYYFPIKFDFFETFITIVTR